MKKLLALLVVTILLLSGTALAETAKALEGKFIPVLPLGVAH